MTSHYLKQISNHRIKLRLEGLEVEITQGELCEIMEQRVEELKEHRKLLVNNGASASEIVACDDLVADYNTSLNRSERSKL